MEGQAAMWSRATREAVEAGYKCTGGGGGQLHKDQSENESQIFSLTSVLVIIERLARASFISSLNATLSEVSWFFRRKLGQIVSFPKGGENRSAVPELYYSASRVMSV